MKQHHIVSVIGLGFIVASFCAQAAQVSKKKADEGIEWPPYSEQLADGPKAGFYPHTDIYVTTLGAPQFLRKGMYYFSIPAIWYEKNDGSALTDEGFLLKKAKDRFVGGRVCDAVALGTDLHEGNYSWVCEADMIASDKYYFRKDDPVLTGAKVKKEEDIDLNDPRVKALID